MGLYIISYDISSNKKRKKVFDILRSYGLGLQYSMFIIECEEKIVKKIAKEIEKIIEEGDRLGIYEIYKEKDAFSFGRPREEVKFEL